MEKLSSSWRVLYRSFHCTMLFRFGIAHVGFVGEDVTGGKIKLSISFDNIQVVNEELDLCETLPEIDLECPLKKGTHTVSTTQNLPDSIPSVSPQAWKVMAHLVKSKGEE